MNKIMNRIGVTLLLVTLLLGISCKSQNFFWSHNYRSDEVDLTTCVEYGLLYNWYVVDDARELTSSDEWTVPVNNDFKNLADYLGASGNYSTNTVGGYLKDTSSAYWDSPNTGATDEYYFNARGGGLRVSSFSAKNTYQYFHTSNVTGGSTYQPYLRHNTNTFYCNTASNSYRGASIRLIKDATGHADGDTTIYVGNDGTVYNAVAINGLYWTTDNLKETLFRDGSIIPFHGADNDTAFTNAEWAALTTAGACAYNNDRSYVGCDFEWPDYNIDGWVYSGISADISSHVDIPAAIQFNDDGTKLFVLSGNDDSLFCYTMSSYYDISTLQLSNSFYVGDKSNYPGDFYIDKSGTKLYVIDFYVNGNKKVFQYSLTDWNLASASYVAEFYLGDYSISNYAGLFSPDNGINFYVFDAVSDKIEKWVASTQWDITTLSYSSQSIYGNARTIGLNISPDGVFSYESLNTGYIEMYILGTQWDLTTRGSSSDVSLYVSPYPALPHDSEMNPKGSSLFIAGADNKIYKWIKQ